jgi:hypothetical protein
MKRRFGGTFRLHLQGRKNASEEICLSVTVYSFPLSCYFFYPEEGETRFTETSVYNKTTRGHIPDFGILHSHRCENFSLARVISSTLKMEATRSSETSVNYKSIWRHIPEDGILRSHRRVKTSNPTNISLVY